MSREIRSIVIVGGGSAGWITAGRIAAEHKENPQIQVTLIESPSISTVGVGEGTWPTMRNTLHALGIKETDFIRECDASFKQGAKFARWVDGGENDFYYHPLMLPQGFTKGDLAPYWQSTKSETGLSFSEAVCFQEALCENGLAPKSIRTPEYGSVANYAYHLNAGKFAELLKRHCTSALGVNHILDDVETARLKESGDIEAVCTLNTGDITGDLFIDCSGFSSLLLGKTLGVPFRDCSDVLFIDNALAIQIPYENEFDPIASHTISTAQTAGWIWDIGLKHRRGIGHVYSSRHTLEEKALAELEAYVGPMFDESLVKSIPIHAGHRQKFWKNNCVAVGLSAGFLEPLEASALVLVELSASMIAEQLPATRETMSIIEERFNSTFLYRWERIIDFLKLHYCISKRRDSQFWIDNCDKESIPESLQNLLKLWEHRSPADCDFDSNNEVFPAASYQYILYGMDFESQFDQLSERQKVYGNEQMAINNKMIRKALESLPKNRDLLDKIHEFGLQAI